MVDALPNLQMVYAKWQSRNPYLHGNQPYTRPAGYSCGSGGDSYMNGPKPWQANLGSSVCSPTRRRAAKERGRNRRENCLSNAEEVMVRFFLLLSGMYRLNSINQADFNHGFKS